MSLRILHIANQAGPLHLFMGPHIEALRRAGADVELACMPTGALWSALSQGPQDVHRIPPGSWKHPATWWRVYRWARRFFRKESYDLIVVHTPAMSWLVRPAARGQGAPVVYFAHGLPFSKRQFLFLRLIPLGIERWLARYTDGLIVMNREDAEAARRYRLIKPGGRWIQVPGVGVDLTGFAQQPPEALERLESELRLRRGVPLVVFLGRFIRSKRPGDVLELARRTGDRVDYILAGEGPLWPRIHRQAQRLGSYVRVLPFVDKVPALLARCTVVVLPSVFREGLPRVLLEAGAAGRPAVAYDVRGSQDVVVHNKTGCLVAPGDVERFCACVEELLADPDRCAALGRAARAHVEAHFALPRVVERVRDFLLELAGQEPGTC